jgi:hypothetical protein
MKKYTTPELEIMEFELEDVLTMSIGGSYDGDGNFNPYLPEDDWA